MKAVGKAEKHLSSVLRFLQPDIPQKETTLAESSRLTSPLHGLFLPLISARGNSLSLSLSQDSPLDANEV